MRANFSHDLLGARGAREGVSERSRSRSCVIEVKTVPRQSWDRIEVEISEKKKKKTSSKTGAKYFGSV